MAVKRRRQGATDTASPVYTPVESGNTSEFQRTGTSAFDMQAIDVDVIDLTTTPASADTISNPISPSTSMRTAYSHVRKRRRTSRDTSIAIPVAQSSAASDDQHIPTRPTIHSTTQIHTGLLSSVRCVICLEQPTDLVTTQCGHLFCNACLRSACVAMAVNPLRRRAQDNIQSKCPVCRRKMTMKSIVALEIKVAPMMVEDDSV